MLQMSKLQTIEFKWLLQDNLVFLLQTLNSYQLVVNVILNDLIVLNEHICILEPEALSWNLGLPAAPLCNWQQGSTEPVSCVLSCLPFLRSLNLPSYTRITTLDFFFFSVSHLLRIDFWECQNSTLCWSARMPVIGFWSIQKFPHLVLVYLCSIGFGILIFPLGKLDL